jgi:hypothetical protein
MTALASLLVILTFSFLCTRMATVALSLTGLSRDLARLQAVSAFTGVGFTTGESERIVNHPVRRRILILLMIVGNAGVVTSIASLLLSFSGLEGAGEGVTRFVYLGSGVAVLWMVATSRWIERGLDPAIRWALDRWTRLRAVDYSELLDLSGDYRVREMAVERGDWVEDRELGELGLFQEGIVVLGIHRSDGSYVGVPRGETRVEDGDRLVLYGPADAIHELDERRRGVEGDEAHEQGMQRQSEARRSQRRRQAQRERHRPDAG